MKELYVVNCCRTAIGSFGGALKNTSAVELGAIVAKEVMNRAGQRENRNGDEREKAIQIQGESFSLIFIFLLGGVLIWWKRAHGLPAADIQAMFWMSCAASRIYRLAQRRNLSDLITLVLCLALLAWNLVQFFSQG